ncbi:MAG TPA: DoxX family protein [Candidatus Saccharimonadales bacterium]|nr:DoxX family protein [Candidatus Saccharimonadales bacterium]
MKKYRIAYWVSTSVVAAVMLWSAINFSLNEEMKNAFARLGLPNWFKAELTVAKFLGTFALLLPATPRPVRVFTYAGFTITLVSAVIAHAASGDGVQSLEPLIFLTALAMSYASLRQLKTGASGDLTPAASGAVASRG